MDVKTPSRVRDRSGDLYRERGEHSTRGRLVGLDPGRLFPLHHDVGLVRPMMSPNILDVLEVVVC
jgi:hypothetical protein